MITRLRRRRKPAKGRPFPERVDVRREPVHVPRVSTCLAFAPTADPHLFVAADGTKHRPPPDWSCLEPGDAGLTRRVKAAGPSWLVTEKRGRKTFSKGLWAPRANIEAARAELVAERATEAYAKKRTAETARRERAQEEYVAAFETEVLAFLHFSKEWELLGRAVAKHVAAHATPVGSGTVARTKRIPVAERAEAAVIAWLRHQTTGYDDMQIARIKGERRAVRRALAQRSRALLDRHRKDIPHGIADCSLCDAIVSKTRADAADAARAAPRNRVSASV